MLHLRRGVLFVVTLIGLSTSYASPVDVAYKVTPIDQGLTNLCWLASATMVLSSKEAGLIMKEVARRAGPEFLAMYEDPKHEGIPFAKLPAFAKATGFVTEAPQNYTAHGWAAMLKKHGPLWVGGAFPTPNGQYVAHVRIVTGMKGDDSSAKEIAVTFIDPMGGKVGVSDLVDFIESYEQFARQSGATDLTPQVLHMP